MVNKVSVIVPSRLAINPASATDRLYLGRALQSATDYQSADVETEAVCGLDPGMLAKVPPYLIGPKLRIVEADKPGQAAAVNAAVRASTGDVLAFCEDDDTWHTKKLAVQLSLLESYDLVTCNQREQDAFGNYVRVNNFPTPSGWLLRRETWEKVGGFDSSFRFHVDTEWLGRANAAKLSRVHVVNAGCVEDDWLRNVARYSEVLEMSEITEPLVNRTVNPEGGMETIRTNEEARIVSAMEHARLFEAFGVYPW